MLRCARHARVSYGHLDCGCASPGLQASCKGACGGPSSTAQYDIVLPAVDDLPKSYTSLRMWFNCHIATKCGRYKRLWQELKQDAAHLQYVREQNRLHVLA